MKRFFTLFQCIIITLWAATLTAAPPNPGPEVITLKTGPFYHKKHQSLQNSECFHCHKPDKWKIDNWGKDIAHQICISCHDLSEKGPVKCDECHKK